MPQPENGFEKSWLEGVGGIEFDASGNKFGGETCYEIEPPVDWVISRRRVGRQLRKADGWANVPVNFEKLRLLVHIVSSAFLLSVPATAARSAVVPTCSHPILSPQAERPLKVD